MSMLVSSTTASATVVGAVTVSPAEETRTGAVLFLDCALRLAAGSALAASVPVAVPAAESTSIPSAAASPLVIAASFAKADARLFGCVFGFARLARALPLLFVDGGRGTLEGDAVGVTSSSIVVGGGGTDVGGGLSSTVSSPKPKLTPTLIGLGTVSSLLVDLDATTGLGNAFVGLPLNELRRRVEFALGRFVSTGLCAVGVAEPEPLDVDACADGLAERAGAAFAVALALALTGGSSTNKPIARILPAVIRPVPRGITSANERRLRLRGWAGSA